MKKISLIVVTAVLAVCMCISAYAAAPANVKWDFEHEYSDSGAGVSFDLVPGINAYKLSLLKDGVNVDDSILIVDESSDGSFYTEFDKEIEENGEGSYVLSVGTVEGNPDDYMYAAAKDVTVLESAVTPVAYKYTLPASKLPAPSAVEFNGTKMKIVYTGPKCLFDAGIYIDRGDGKVHKISSFVYDTNEFDISMWLKQFNNWVDYSCKQYPDVYKAENMKMILKARAFPVNITKIQASDECVYTEMYSAAPAPQETPATEKNEQTESENVTETSAVTPLNLPTGLPDIDAAGFNNPFNNSLFKVVAEFVVPDDFNEPVDSFENAYNFYEYTDTEVVFNPVIFKVNYDGSTEMRSLLGGTTTDGKAADDAYNKAVSEIEVPFYKNPEKDVFHDGIVYKNVDWLTGLYDVNGIEKFVDAQSSGTGYDYNMGLLRVIDAASGFMSIEYDTYRTSFQKIVTDGSEYRFNAYITDFNNDGYAIMHTSFGGESRHFVIKLKAGIIPTVIYNGNKVLFDQIPVIDGGRTLVPVRAIFESLGATVEWDGDTRTVTAVKGDITIKLTIDNTVATKNGSPITLDVPAKIISGRTMVPVRFIADSFGVKVGWDGEISQVKLTD